MTTAELFIEATKKNFQFPFRGMINIIDLWELSVQSLDLVFKSLNADYKKSEEESLLSAQTKESEELSEKIEIVKYIVNEKLAEKKAKEDAKKNREMKQRLLEIKAKRQDAALEGLSDAELDKMIQAME
ncbi:hypothetical protein GPK90_05285 [Clostridium sp. MCC344]|nr:hypothetical protein [Clostridium sp. MCC344]MBT9788758.1 hypothetical protein [Clostridium sp. MCC344]